MLVLLPARNIINGQLCDENIYCCSFNCCCSDNVRDDQFHAHILPFKSVYALHTRIALQVYINESFKASLSDYRLSLECCDID